MKRRCDKPDGHEDRLFDRILELEAELDRLRAENEDLQGHVDVLLDSEQKALAEVERLRDTIKERAAASAVRVQMDGAEVNRLRSVLKQIGRKHCYFGCSLSANHALEGTSDE